MTPLDEQGVARAKATAMRLHKGIYEHMMERKLPQPGFKCRVCTQSAPCAWQVKHAHDCPWKPLEGWLPSAMSTPDPDER